MSSGNLAVVFTPCLLFPSDASRLSERDLELSTAVLRAFIDSPRMFGALIPFLWFFLYGLNLGFECGGGIDRYGFLRADAEKD